MNDEKKFKIALAVSTSLVVLVLSYNLFLGPLVSGIGDYAKRRVYYEKVISKKGLSLHKGMYWKEKK